MILRTDVRNLAAAAVVAIGYWLAISVAVTNPGLFTAPAAGVCGTERWPVKTLTDRPGQMLIQKRPTPTTIARLTSFPARGKKELLRDESTRIAPQELTVYQLDAVVLGFKRETDEDIHIVLADPKNRKRTMVAEIPAGACMPTELQARFALLQKQFTDAFGLPTAKFKTLAQPAEVMIRGVGFFDFIHGQTGVAKNGFELHPVLGWNRP